MAGLFDVIRWVLGWKSSPEPPISSDIPQIVELVWTPPSNEGFLWSLPEDDSFTWAS